MEIKGSMKPGPVSMNSATTERYQRYVIPNYTRYPVCLVRGQGSHVWDVDGTEYVDFHGGFGVNVVGHAHPVIVEAIQRAATQEAQLRQPFERGVHPGAILLLHQFALLRPPDQRTRVLDAVKRHQSLYPVLRFAMKREVLCGLTGPGDTRADACVARL